MLVIDKVIQSIVKGQTMTLAMSSIPLETWVALTDVSRARIMATLTTDRVLQCAVKKLHTYLGKVPSPPPENLHGLQQ